MTGTLSIHWDPEEQPDRPSCALDVADANGLTRTEVGAVMGISHERVRQLEERALRKLKKRRRDFEQ